MQSIKCTDNSQPGWKLTNDKVELFITEFGGHLAPVNFNIDSALIIQPYYISPWQNENIQEFGDPVLAPLRGDFFCMPFGGNAEPVDGEQHSVHGEVSSSPWQFVEHSKAGVITTLTLEMQTTARQGRVTKKIQLYDGQNVIYTTHIIEGYSGSMPIGHHCTLAVPEAENSMKVSVSEFEFGMTSPTLFSDPANGEYQSFTLGEKFTDLSQVPVIWKKQPPADCTSFPQRLGFTDLLQIFKQPSTTPAWTVALCPEQGYLWFSLKDAAQMPGTVFWISNKGRHGSPWNGRNRCLGLEETCSYFADGLKPSTEVNMVNEAGFPTALELSPETPTTVNFIQGVAAIPEDFTQLKNVTFGDDSITFHSITGESVTIAVNHQFLNFSYLDCVAR
ncbi:MAG: hypothetical protein L3J71_00300 [Victivallaceae bacterium]|nr:hypothetical protein [Victivallaceae bacterium]